MTLREEMKEHDGSSAGTDPVGAHRYPHPVLFMKIGSDLTVSG